MPTKIHISNVEWETLRVDDSKTAMGRGNENVVHDDVGASSGFDHSSSAKARAEIQTSIENIHARMVTKTTTKRGKGGKKDPNKPKHPISAYLFFAMEMRPKLRAAGDDPSGVALGERWRSISQEERRRFDFMAVEDSQRYHREMAAYNNERLNAVTPPAAQAASAATGLI
jgi:hypothetical protein